MNWSYFYETFAGYTVIYNLCFQSEGLFWSVLATPPAETLTVAKEAFIINNF